MEPDAVAHIVEGCGGRENERYSLLADAVSTLKSSPGTFVYLDAGHPAWVSDVRKLADALRRAGIGRADGFSLNVSNFIRTPDNIDYGVRLSDALGGRRFVVDTSRNGAGPVAGAAEVNGGPSWCNPPGRALGTAPTAGAGHPRVDALLWIKRPGESDGACRPGEPAAGQWWPEYALDLANAPSPRGSWTPVHALACTESKIADEISPTDSHRPTEGTPDASTTNSRYGPGGIRAGAAGTASVSSLLPLPATMSSAIERWSVFSMCVADPGRISRAELTRCGPLTRAVNVEP